MFFVSEKIEKYAKSVSHTPSEVCEEIAAYTLAHVPMSIMLTGAIEAGFLSFLIQTIGAKRVLEIGTYTGYSALAMAEALPPGGKVVTIDKNPETSALAQQFWQKSPHGSKIELKLGEALKILPTLEESFDFAFIDALKTEYEQYIDHALRLLQPNGVIAVDNTLYLGMVLDEEVQDPRPQAIIKLNKKLKARDDITVMLLPIRDGVTLIRKKR